MRANKYCERYLVEYHGDIAVGGGFFYSALLAYYNSTCIVYMNNKTNILCGEIESYGNKHKNNNDKFCCNRFCYNYR